MGTINHKKRKTSLKNQVRGLGRNGVPLKLLKYAGEHALLIGAIALSGPGLGIAAQRYLFGGKAKNKEEIQTYNQRVAIAAKRLQQKNLVRLTETPEGTMIELTSIGKQIARQEILQDDMQMQSARWDGKWRLVLFDIPEEKRRGRDALRKLLRDVGFYQLQQSVLVTPYPCERAVTRTADSFEVERYVTYATATELGRQESEVRKHFGLSA